MNNLTMKPIRSATQPSYWNAALASLALVACGGAGSGTADTPASNGTTPPTVPSSTLSVPADYQMVWADEFDAPGHPDATKWGHDTFRNKPGWFNNEKQYYSGPRLENAEVKDGVLTITARKEARSSEPDWGGQAYSSARLLTAGKKDFTYGFFEVRAKVSCGKGTWPAIWTLGSTGGDWPANGELDIMEWLGSNPNRMFSTVHTTAGSGGSGKGADRPIADACTVFHNYQMHWTAKEINFGVDGKVHFTYTNPGTGKAAWPFDAPQFLLLNVAIGGDLGGPVDDSIFPTRMVVDYVRVYQKSK
jgi:beta-glucanase (GH16 family)